MRERSPALPGAIGLVAEDCLVAAAAGLVAGFQELAAIGLLPYLHPAQEETDPAPGLGPAEPAPPLCPAPPPAATGRGRACVGAGGTGLGGGGCLVAGAIGPLPRPAPPPAAIDLVAAATGLASA